MKHSHINQTLKSHLEELGIQKINSGVQRLLTPPSIRAAMNTQSFTLLPMAVKKTEAVNSPEQSWAPAADSAALPVPAATSAAANIFSFGLNNQGIASQNLWVKSRLLLTSWAKLCLPLAAHKFCHHLYLSVITPPGSFCFVLNTFLFPCSTPLYFLKIHKFILQAVKIFLPSQKNITTSAVLS